MASVESLSQSKLSIDMSTSAVLPHALVCLREYKKGSQAEQPGRTQKKGAAILPVAAQGRLHPTGNSMVQGESFEAESVLTGQGTDSVQG